MSCTLYLMACGKSSDQEQKTSDNTAAPVTEQSTPEANRVPHKSQQLYEGTKKSVVEAGTAVKEKAVEVGTAIGEKSSEYYDAVKEKSIEVIDATKDKGAEAIDSLKNQ